MTAPLLSNLDIVAPQPPATQKDESPDYEKMRKTVSKVLILVGLGLIGAASSFLIGYAIGLIVLPVAAVQTLFYCGLAAVLAGCSQKNYNGTVSLTPAGLPFSVKVNF